MKVKDLVSKWQTDAATEPPGPTYQVRLPIYDAAKIAALCEIFPGVDEQRILGDLIGAALGDVSSAFAYEPGDEIAGYDEAGEPMYTDAGLRPRFQQLARRHAEQLERL